MLSWEYPPNLDGGLGAHVTELVPALAAQGVDLTLVTPRWKGGAHMQRVNENAVVYRVDPPVRTPSNFYADVQQTNLTLEHFIQELWEEKGGFDLIHAHDWLVSFVAIALKKLHKTSLVATMHATERGRSGGHLYGEMSNAINGAEWWLTYEAWRVITTSQFMARELRSYFEVPDDKLLVIPNGIESGRFSHLLRRDLHSFRDEWAAPDERLVFYVGRMQYEKGLHLLVEAADRILARGDRVKFVMAGRGSMLAPLRQRVAELGLSDRVLLPGYVSDQVRDKLYAVADVAVFPSLYEPFGIVALEAMAARCPVIVSNVGGLGEVVENHQTGIKIPSYDLNVLVDSIEYVLHHPEVARACAERAYELVHREYAWDHIARETIRLYGEVIEARAKVEWE
jgi:glycogen(starch) synthase